MKTDSLDADAPYLRNVTVWREGKLPDALSPGAKMGIAGIPWFDLLSNASVEQLFPRLSKACPGLSEEMLDDLLTPDDRPEGAIYSGGRIKLASTFAVHARRLEQKHERGKAMRSGILVFQPVELLASKDWLLTCWHPTRTFAGAEKISEGAPGTSEAMQREISREWIELDRPGGGDLGILIMHRLALTYRAAGWRLTAWHEDWELSLYVEDALDNPEELPNLWGMMAVLRDWLNPLNRPGLRKMPDRAWLPSANHDQVVAVDSRIDDTLKHLHGLANSMRASFSVLHVQTAEEARDRKERTQHRVELIAAIFLVPTLVVGFYGANTWVPGQGQHWGFWVMSVVLLVLTSGAVATVLNWRHREKSEARRVAEKRNTARQELLKAVRS
jgi:hypothetical protein